MTKIAYTPESVRELSKLDRQLAKRIRDYMGEVETLEDPHSRRKGLTSNLSGLWRYRIGDYRIISRITESESDEKQRQTVITVLVVYRGHRKEVYKQS